MKILLNYAHSPFDLIDHKGSHVTKIASLFEENKKILFYTGCLPAWKHLLTNSN